MNQTLRAFVGRLPRWAWGAPFVVLLACGGTYQDIKGRLTISQGVYGLMLSKNCHQGCKVEPMAGATVALYATDPDVPGGEAASPIASTTSNAQGFYEIAADPGTYFVAGVNGSGASLIRWTHAERTPVAAGKAWRLDYERGPEGGFWRTILFTGD